MHCDQGSMPLPWPSGRALTANMTWALNDYTAANGALCYVPGSHRRLRPPEFPAAAEQAIAVECPRGSAIIFHGATWHGALPKLTRGLRVSYAAYFRHKNIKASPRACAAVRSGACTCARCGVQQQGGGPRAIARGVACAFLSPPARVAQTEHGRNLPSSVHRTPASGARAQSQDNIQFGYPKALADQCDDPETFRALAGFADKYPYVSQYHPLPRAVGTAPPAPGARL